MGDKNPKKVLKKKKTDEKTAVQSSKTTATNSVKKSQK